MAKFAASKLSCSGSGKTKCKKTHTHTHVYLQYRAEKCIVAVIRVAPEKSPSHANLRTRKKTSSTLIHLEQAGVFFCVLLSLACA